MPEHDLPPKQLLHLFLHIGRLLDERLRAPLARAGVHHGQGRVLDALQRHGRLTVGELATGLYIAQPTATVMAQRMQSDGFIERWIDPEDNRRVMLELTERGRSAAHAVRRAWKDAEDELCALLPPAERLRLRLLLEGLRDGLGGASPQFLGARERSNEAVAIKPGRRPRHHVASR